MSDPNRADLDDAWAEAEAAVKELREGIDRLRERVRLARRRLAGNDDTDQSPA
jgi:hypothetical protein